ncbi:MAG TPA: hypothetical protein VKE72_00080 [Methylocella sp.]|nr:hypothetical protein [Methylocella sp.]
MALRRLRTGQSDQPGFLFAVENRQHRGAGVLLAGQGSLKTLFHQLLARPINHRGGRFQSSDDLAVAETGAGFGNIRHHQDLRLRQLVGPLRSKALKLLAFLRVAPDNLFLYRNFHLPHDRLRKNQWPQRIKLGEAWE